MQSLAITENNTNENFTMSLSINDEILKDMFNIKDRILFCLINNMANSKAKKGECFIDGHYYAELNYGFIANECSKTERTTATAIEKRIGRHVVKGNIVKIRTRNKYGYKKLFFRLSKSFYEKYKNAAKVFFEEAVVCFKKRVEPVNKIIKKSVEKVKEKGVEIMHKVIIEIKSIKELNMHCILQTRQYMKSTGIETALLFNFGPIKLEWRRVFIC